MFITSDQTFRFVKCKHFCFAMSFESDNLDFVCFVRTVAFADPIVSPVIVEDPFLCEDLKESRISDWARHLADTQRMEKLLSPTLTVEHRANILSWNSV